MWLPCDRKLMQHVDLGEPTSFLDHVHLGCTQRECKANEIVIFEYRENVRIMLVEALQCCCTVGHITACYSRLDTDMHLVH